MDESIVLDFNTRIFNTPWMILPEKFDVILANYQSIGKNIVTPKFSSLSLSESSNISVIEIHGPLLYRSYGGFMAFLMGTTKTYDEIRNEFHEALENKSKAILLDIDSPGGEANGVMDLADEIYSMRGKKPIYAIANESAYSAAYAIASGADKIFLSRTAEVGSVGVIAGHTDQSKYDEDLGVKYTTVFAGARKIDFNRHKPLSDEAKAILQEEVNEHYKMFVQTVATNRKLTANDVMKTEAGLFTGEKAVSIGLADEVMSYVDALNKIGQADRVMFKANRTLNTLVNAEPDEPREHSPREEVEAMNLDEFKEKYPELLKEIETGLTATVTTSLTEQFKAEKATMRQQFDQEKGQLSTKVLTLEKREAIRTEKELKATADSIWTSKLSASEIPVRLFDKVRGQVNHEKFVKDDALDTATFSAAVDTEIADWEKDLPNSVVLGIAFTEKSDVGDKIEERQKKNDEDLAKALFSFAGTGGEEVKT